MRTHDYNRKHDGKRSAAARAETRRRREVRTIKYGGKR